MILTDREIQIFLANRQISIKPEPDSTRYSSTSVDLTLAKQLRVWSFDQIEKSKGEIITRVQRDEGTAAIVQRTKIPPP